MPQYITIIDSGIDSKIVKNRIKNSYEYDKISSRFKSKYIHEDRNGHGTACALTILKVSHDVNFYSIKVLDENLKCSNKRLIEALRFAATLEPKVINLSLATLHEQYIEEMKNVCEELKDIGKIIVCSVANGHDSSLPAKLPHVIGVKGSLLEDNFWFDHTKEIQCVADLEPIFTCRELNDFFLFSGNSKAAALISGHICNFLYENPCLSFEETLIMLEKKSSRIQWETDESNPVSFPPKYAYVLNPEEDLIRQKIESIIKQNHENMSFPMSPKYIVTFLERIEKEFRFDSKNEELNWKIFFDIYFLIEWVKGKIK